MPMAALPNILSGLRILLVLPYVVLLLENRFAPALCIFVVAAVTDGVDGWLARRFGWQSQLGAVLDPAADKLLVAVSLILLSWLTMAPAWVVVVVLARDVVIVAGALAYRRWIGPVAYGSTRLSKICTALQLLLILALLLQPLLATGLGSTGQWPSTTREVEVDLLAHAVQVLAVAVAVLAVMSGADYVWTWTRKAIAQRARVAP